MSGLCGQGQEGPAVNQLDDGHPVSIKTFDSAVVTGHQTCSGVVFLLHLADPGPMSLARAFVVGRAKRGLGSHLFEQSEHKPENRAP